MKKTAFLTGTFIALPLIAMAQGLGGGPCGYGFGPGMHGYFGYGGGIVMWILTITVVAFLVFAGIRMFKDRKDSGAAADDPLKVLKARYARGEITREQFDSMKKDIA